MLTSPREARIALCAVVVLAGAAIANVALLQNSVRERRLTQVPVGLATPAPEVRRAGGPVTLSLASLLETAPVPEQQPTATPPPAAPAPAAAPTGRVSPITQTIDRLIAPATEPSIPPVAPIRQQELVRQIQSELTTRGYAPGPVDGGAGMLTRAAILAFEHDHGLPASAEATETMLAALRKAAPTRRPAVGANWRSPTQAATALVKSVQQQLIAAGHLTGAPSGQLDARTIAAIRSFETANDMMQTGRISAPLVAKLQRAGSSRSRLASGQ